VSLALRLPLAAMLAAGLAGPATVPDSHAVQSVYQVGVPHTDAQGSPRSRYGAGSFFPRCIYHAMPGSLAAIRDAGFNCVHTWEGLGVGDMIGELRATGLQLIRHQPTDDEVRRFASDPRILGWYLDEEPTSQTHLDMARSGNPGLMAERYQAFVARMAAIKAMDSRHPVFVLDGPYAPPGLGAWWDRWNSSGDVSAHDYYPLRPGVADLSGMAESVLRAARLNGERKPVWITLQAFGGLPGLEVPMRVPSADELRGMAFTAIIHGATGLIFFAYDSRVTREGHVVGISPDTPESRGSGAEATPADALRSRELWSGAAALNAELERLTPALLSPTARLPYQVRFAGDNRTAVPIRTMLKATDGGYTLLAVNLEASPMGVRFRLPAGVVGSVRRLNPDGSATALEAFNGEFGDAMGGFGAGVYEITR
jgi:hypothetical protein